MKVSIDSSSRFVVGVSGLNAGIFGVVVAVHEEHETVLFSNGSSVTLSSNVLMEVIPEQTKFLDYQIENLFKSSNIPTQYGEFVADHHGDPRGICIGWNRKGGCVFIDIVTPEGDHLEVRDLMTSVITEVSQEFRAAAEAALIMDQKRIGSRPRSQAK